MGISDMHVIPMIITCMLQGTLCDTGIPCTFYGGNICSVVTIYPVSMHPPFVQIHIIQFDKNFTIVKVNRFQLFAYVSIAQFIDDIFLN